MLTQRGSRQPREYAEDGDQEPEFAGARKLLRVFVAVMLAATVACGLAGYLVH